MNEKNLNKLYWACRRGMLELDVLLGNFLKTGYEGLDQVGKDRFEKLLSSPDPELFAWLMGREVPEDPDMAAIVKEIIRHAKS